MASAEDGTERIHRLEEENRKQRIRLIEQEKFLDDLQKRLNDQEKRLSEKEKLVGELEIKLAKALRSSANSSKRPSSDIVKPPRAKGKNKDKQEKRKIGGQAGHPKQDREPFSEKDIDRFILYSLTCCPDCQGPVRAGGYLPEVVQQVEVVAKPVEITEHRAPCYWCERCQKLHRTLPVAVDKSGLCGPLLMARIAYLKGGCHASFSTIRKFVRDVLGIRLSRGLLAKVIAKVSAALEEPWNELRMLLPLAKILNIDETGHKENGARMQTWCFRARDYILFKIAESRGTAVLLEMLGADFDGVIGCDFFSSYRCYMNDFGGVLQFCLAHLIREVKFLIDLPDKATREYGQRFLDGLRELFSIIHRREEMTALLFGYLLGLQRAKILCVATCDVPPTKEAKNLASRLKEHGESYFRFITTPGIDPTNNLAEQAIRFVVIDRLVTQGTRGQKGQRWCERIWTVLATCEQRGASAFNFIRDAIQAFFTGAPAPSLLAASP